MILQELEARIQSLKISECFRMMAIMALFHCLKLRYGLQVMAVLQTLIHGATHGGHIRVILGVEATQVLIPVQEAIPAEALQVEAVQVEAIPVEAVQVEVQIQVLQVLRESVSLL